MVTARIFKRYFAIRREYCFLFNGLKAKTYNQFNKLKYFSSHPTVSRYNELDLFSKQSEKKYHEFFLQIKIKKHFQPAVVDISCMLGTLACLNVFPPLPLYCACA